MVTMITATYYLVISSCSPPAYLAKVSSFFFCNVGTDLIVYQSIIEIDILYAFILLLPNTTGFERNIPTDPSLVVLLLMIHSQEAPATICLLCRIQMPPPADREDDFMY